MKKAEYVKGEPYDRRLPVVIGIARRAILNPKRKDDGVFLAVGNTGTGKTHLTLHCVSIFTPTPAVEQITLTKEDFAKSLKYGLRLPKGERFIAFDESDVGAREAMGRWNRDVIKLYFKIREKGFLHFWNHPSPNNIDREFIRERVNGLFLTNDKNTDKPRRYAFFTKERLLDFFEHFGKLTTRNLWKHRQEYAAYQGKFLAYDGPLLKPYNKQKDEGMDTAIDEFVAEWGGEDVRTYNLPKASKTLGVSHSLVKKLTAELVDNGTLSLNEITNIAGKYRLTEQHLDLLKDLQQKKREEKRLREGKAL